MQPSDFPTPPAVASVPLAGGLPRCRSFFWAGHACPRKRAARRRRITGSPHHRVPSRRGKDLPGYWAVLFTLAVAQHPAGPDPSLPLPILEEIHEGTVVTFTQNRTLGIRMTSLSRPQPHGPRARVPTLRRPRWRDRREARYRPGRAHPWPGRICAPLDDGSKFHGVIARPPIPIDQQSLVALFRLSAVRGHPAKHAIEVRWAVTGARHEAARPRQKRGQSKTMT